MENRIARKHGRTTYEWRFESPARTPKIRFSQRRHCVATKRYVVFILSWKDITAMSDLIYVAITRTYPFIDQF